MSEQAAFAELLRRHEELTQRFARLLHDDAGQVLTSIALQLSVLDGAEPTALKELMGTLDDLLERFRHAQATLGGAVVSQRGLLAGLSQLSRMRDGFRVYGDVDPQWSVACLQAAFRIVEALEPKKVTVDGQGLQLEGVNVPVAYVIMLAESSGLMLKSGPQANTIKICHVNSGTHR